MFADFSPTMHAIMVLHPYKSSSTDPHTPFNRSDQTVDSYENWSRLLPHSTWSASSSFWLQTALQIHPVHCIWPCQLLIASRLDEAKGKEVNSISFLFCSWNRLSHWIKAVGQNWSWEVAKCFHFREVVPIWFNRLQSS